MKACLAQFESCSDVRINLRRHREAVERAAAAGCDVVVFPELSLTGYEPRIASREAVAPDDALFDPLVDASSVHGIVIAAGMPLKATNGTEIGLVVCRPGRPVATYAKQFLHSDEVPYFVPGHRQLDLTVGEHRIAPAICYEAMLPEHGEAAVARGATIYAASVAKHASGMESARAYLAAFAARHSVPVLLVNAIGPSDTFVSSGGSVAFRETGQPIDSVGDAEGELIVELS